MFYSEANLNTDLQVMMWLWIFGGLWVMAFLNAMA